MHAKQRLSCTMTKSFVVTKCSPVSLVAPSEVTPSGSLPFTATDKSRLCTPFALLQVFERPVPHPADTVRRALSGALVHYYPFAGRLAGHGPDIHLACSGDGVPFLAATAACTLADARFLHAPLAIPLADLAIQYGGRCRMSDPLVMLQVTEFGCGGFVLGVSWNHGMTDTYGLALLLQAVGEIARGASPAPSVAPVRHDVSLPEIPQLLTALAPSLVGRKQHARLVCTDVTIAWSYIERVKAAFASQTRSGVGRPTTFEVVAAAVWQCRSRVTGAASSCPAPLVFSANVRGRVGAKAGYYGNCIVSQLVTASTGEVADADVVEVVKLVRRAKGRIPETLASGGGGALGEELIGALCGYGALVMASWAGLGLEGVDLGGGPPGRVMASMEMTVMPTCITNLPCTTKDGVSVMAFCVREEHARRFHAQLARLR